jgi:hypothetical protein
LLTNVADGSDGTAIPSLNSIPDFDAVFDSQSDWLSIVHSFPEGGEVPFGIDWDSAAWQSAELRTVTAIARIVGFFILLRIYFLWEAPVTFA